MRNRSSSKELRVTTAVQGAGAHCQLDTILTGASGLETRKMSWRRFEQNYRLLRQTRGRVDAKDITEECEERPLELRVYGLVEHTVWEGLR